MSNADETGAGAAAAGGQIEVGFTGVLMWNTDFDTTAASASLTSVPPSSFPPSPQNASRS